MLIRVDSNVSDDSPFDDLELQPGPRDPSILYLQAEHRSTIVWNAGGGDSQRSRVRSKFPALHPRMLPILRRLRFDGVARLTSITIDWSLVTALVERWRPETHTFHLPTGECTITLQDVNILLGLRIDGNAITGCTSAEGGWGDIIKNMFGKAPEANSRALVGGRLKMSWLDSVVPEVLPDHADETELLRYTRVYLLLLLGGILFTDHQGSQVHCMFIPQLRNLNDFETLSWGSGVLAYLYRELCKSCKIGIEEMAGCVLLVQLWAWTRLPTLAPVSRGPSLDIWGDLAGPYSLRWCGPKSFADVGAHVVCVHRLALDVLTPSQFIWQPYTNDILDTLDEHCREGSAIWCYRGPLICFYIVEQHQPDRCVRQLGMVQDIPPPADVYSKDLHNMTLKGKVDVDWGKKHKEHISYWESRLQHLLVVDNVGVGSTDRYNIWYNDITRPYHTRIAAAGSFLSYTLDRISSIARGDEDGDNSLIDSLASHGRRVLEYQYSRGVCQDFPVDDRRVKEVILRGKPKKIGHKGGRGGINAPKRCKDIDNEGGDHRDEETVHLGDVGDHMFDAQDQLFGDTSTHVVDEAQNQDVDEVGHDVDTTNVDPSFASLIPNFNLLSPSDSQWPPVEQQSPPGQQPPIDPALKHQQPSKQGADQDFITPPPQHEQLVEEVEHENPVVEQLEATMDDHQEAVQVQQHMKLRPCKRLPPKFGTEGHKVPENKLHYKRLRKKYA